MRVLPPILALLLVALIANSAFVVREGQSALLLQFGRIEGVGSSGGVQTFSAIQHGQRPALCLAR